jgi:hypothetical protein
LVAVVIFRFAAATAIWYIPSFVSWRRKNIPRQQSFFSSTCNLFVSLSSSQ